MADRTWPDGCERNWYSGSNLLVNLESLKNMHGRPAHVPFRSDPAWKPVQRPVSTGCSRTMRGPMASCQNSVYHFSMHIGQPVIASLEAVGQLLVIEAQQVHHRRMQVMHLDFVLHSEGPEVIG